MKKVMQSQNWEGGMSLLSQVPSGRAASSSNRVDARRLAIRLLSLAAACAMSLAVPLNGGPCGLTAAIAKGKPKSKKTSAAAVQMAKLLEAQGQGVMQCAVKQALDKGANKVDVTAKVTINNRAQVIDVNVKVTVDKGDPAGVRGCVQTLIQQVKFPASDAPLTTIERDWSIQ